MSPLTLAINGDALIGSATANPTTGFTWMVDADSIEKCGPKGSIIVEQSYVKDDADANVSGVGGTANFSVTATDSAKSGSTCAIGFMYAQSWNVQKGWEAKPQKMVLITIA